MSDKLKIFVQKHRAEMDVHTPSANVWSALSKQLPRNPSFISGLLQKGAFKLLLAACTIPVAIGIYYIAKKDTTQNKPTQLTKVNDIETENINTLTANEQVNSSENNSSNKNETTKEFNNLTAPLPSNNDQQNSLIYYNQDRLSGKNGGIDFYTAPKTKPSQQQPTSNNTSEQEVLTASEIISHIKCKGDQNGKIDITPQGIAPFAFNWSVGKTTEDVGNLSAGTYILTITDAQGKTAVFNYQINEPAGLSVSVSTTPAHCNKNDGAISVDVKKLKLETYSYNWSNGKTEASLTHLTSGTYSVTITDNKGCTAKVSTVVENESNVFPVFTVAPSAPLKIDFTNNSSMLNNNVSGAATSWLWEFGDGTTDYNLNPSHTYAHSGTYRACLIAQNAGCRDSACNNVEVSADLFVNIPNVFTPNGDGVNDYFTLTSKGMQKIEMTILDKQGTKVCDLSGLSPTWDGKTSIGNNAPNGTYYYFIKAFGNNNKSYDYKGFLLLNR